MRRRRCLFAHPPLPIAQICGEIIHWECCCLLVGPMFRYRPHQLRFRHNLFGEGTPLHIAHHTASSRFLDAGKLTTRHKGRRGRAGISSRSGHDVSEIDSPGGDANDTLSGLWRWLGYVLNRKRFRTTQTRNNQGFHAESLAAQSALSVRVLLGGSIFCLRQLATPVYTLGVELPFPGSPSGRDGAFIHSPNSCAPRITEMLVPRRGRRGAGTDGSAPRNSGGMPCGEGHTWI